MYADKPLWGIGFRPFFLFGAASGVLLTLSWALQFYQGQLISSYYSPTVWHGHEMIFGFSMAIVAGFLLTASQNWSGLRGVHGWPLIGLVCLWTVGRVVAFLPLSFGWVTALIDLSFIPVLIYALAPYILIKGQERNRKILLILFMLFIANLMVHYWDQMKGLYLAVDIFVVIMLLIAGRVLPFFKMKALQVRPPAPIVILDRVSSVLLVLFVISGLNGNPAFRGIVSLILAGVFLFKLIRFKPIEAFRVPILFVLYLGYFWIVLGFMLVGLGSQVDLPLSWAMHCFTVGGIGVLTLAMMSRVSLGHTGRPIRASLITVTGYVLMNLAILFRVLLPWQMPENYQFWILVTGILWSLSFSLYLVQYTKILISPRLEGQ